MRTTITIAVACVAFVATAIAPTQPSEAAVSRGSYCLQYSQGGTDCSFTSLDQCKATASGIDAECDVAAPQAATQAPGAYAFHHPDASFGIEAATRSSRAAKAATRSGHASRVHRNGDRT
jgi:hypothetical protein